MKTPRPGRGHDELGEARSENLEDPQVETWLKVYEPLRICGAASVRFRTGEDIKPALTELEKTEAYLRIRLSDSTAQTADDIWERTWKLFKRLRDSLQLPLGPRDVTEQTILCWSLHVGDGMPIKAIGRLLSERNQYLAEPWKAGEKTVRERMWIAGEAVTTKVTKTSLPGLMNLTEAWAQEFTVDLSKLSPAPPRVDIARGEPLEQRPIEGDKTEWGGDITVPDGSIVDPGEEFTKTWEIRNAGTVPWIGRYLSRIGVNTGPFLVASPPRVELPDTQPGKSVQISVAMTAPSEPGTYRSHWKQTDEEGRLYFPGPQYRLGIYCTIVVS